MSEMKGYNITTVSKLLQNSPNSTPQTQIFLVHQSYHHISSTSGFFLLYGNVEACQLIKRAVT